VGKQSMLARLGPLSLRIVEVEQVSRLCFRRIAAPAKNYDVKVYRSLVGHKKRKIATFIFRKSVMVKCEVVRGTTKYATMIKCPENSLRDLVEVVIDGVSTPVILRTNMEVFPVEFRLQILD